MVIGGGGGIGSALCDELERAAAYVRVIRLGRPDLDLRDEATIARAAARLTDCRIRLVVNAAGFLHDGERQPEKSLRHLDPEFLERCFAVNAIGPALLMKHILPLLPRRGRAVFTCLSARVGSIGDNRLGGWYGYRASKAALNQLVHTAAIELARTHPDAVCVALHPGTVETRLSAPYLRDGVPCLTPAQSAGHLLAAIDRLGPADSGGFFDWRGKPIPW
ncbi:MAG: SDR family NAD(P)-dependent oxidoreductase [Proteobacteria bacterium]|nr:SDR family NAD(P)-dependent oxidoreductase [Pseudomonadota bacterium]